MLIVNSYHWHQSKQFLMEGCFQTQYFIKKYSTKQFCIYKSENLLRTNVKMPHVLV
jgi:hypothetical protein